ncbi:MAG: hypothetical protein CMQ29_01340 [Gammaproteobacteria bacterium]|nr:hypothetical protein [Gammaproteobacteria bacterium]
MDALTEGYGLIEGPVWDPARGLLFSDIMGGGVYCLDRDGNVAVVFEHRRGIGGMCLHEADGVVVSGRNISFKANGGGPTRMLLDRDEANDLVGFNDITADADGRIYAGSLGNSPVFEDGRIATAGKLFLIDLDGSIRVVAEDVMLTNGLAFSPDNRILYHSDSTRRTIFCYDVEEGGSLGTKRSFAETRAGAPDGLVVAEDGSIWVALAGGSGVGVYNADGTHREHIQIPLPMCTSVCFGGDDLRDLYIVTGSEGVEGDNRGSVYCVRTEVAGLPVGVAKVALPA